MKVYDVIGVGIGPFNLGLAALSAPIAHLDSLFVDQRPGFEWHPGMLLADARLQTPFLSDLVTLADPTSQYSYLNYAKRVGWLYPFYIRENFFLLREEYNQYCQWVCQQLPNLRFNYQVAAIHYDAHADIYRVEGKEHATGRTSTLHARHLVLGTGTQPWTPPDCAPDDPRVLHSADYLQHKPALLEASSITVVGSGQSAAEIFYDLLTDAGRHDYQLRWLTRSPRFFPLEYTKLTLEMTSPEYIDYFYQLPEPARRSLIASQGNLYKGIDADLINAIYDRLYQKSLHGSLDAELCTNVAVTAVRSKPAGLRVACRHGEQRTDVELATERLILATGYRYQLPEFVAPLRDQLALDTHNRPTVGRSYQLDDRSRIFGQNIGLDSHGLSTPDLGMGCYRNSVILREILGYAPYAVEKRIAFQHFGLPGAYTGCVATQEAAS